MIGSLYNKNQITSAKAPEKATLLSFGRSQVERLYGCGVEQILKKAWLRKRLRMTEFFKKLTDAQQEILLDTFQEASFSHGETVVSEGSLPQLIVVIEGQLKGVPGSGRLSFSLKQTEFAK